MSWELYKRLLLFIATTLQAFWHNITTRAAGIEDVPTAKTELLNEATGVSSNVDVKPPLKNFETVKQSSYQDLMQSGDIYSIFGKEEEFVPNSDSEDDSWWLGERQWIVLNFIRRSYRDHHCLIKIIQKEKS